MKKLFISLVLLSASVVGFAQQVTAPEPEFIGSYCMLTSDSTYVVLPKENGKVEKHQNKFSKFSKIAGAVSDLGFAGGMVGLSTGSMSGLETGVRVMGTTAGVGLAADAVNTLAGVEGMDIAFAGGKSAHSIKNDGKNIRLLIKAEKNDYDPMGIYRIVRFKASKKDRRIRAVPLGQLRAAEPRLSQRRQPSPFSEGFRAPWRRELCRYRRGLSHLHCPLSHSIRYALCIAGVSRSWGCEARRSCHPPSGGVHNRGRVQAPRQNLHCQSSDLGYLSFRRSDGCCSWCFSFRINRKQLMAAAGALGAARSSSGA